MNYLEHFQLVNEPFSNAPDARFYYASEQHKQALLKLRYSVDSDKGLAVLVGGVGCGKTTLARRLLEQLPEDKYESSLLVMVHSGVTQEWILTRIAVQLGVENPAGNRLDLLRQLYHRLLEIEEAGRKAVVLIDEAQMLESRELMEEFRGLLNLEIPGKKLLNIIFFGLPDVEECLSLDEPLAQRVAVKCHLRSMKDNTTDAYVRHRLKIAGAKRMFFEPDTLKVIHQFSGGVPRIINTICDNCLFEAYLRKQLKVDLPVVESVVGDLGLTRSAVASAQGGGKVREESAASDDLDEIDSLLDNLEMK
ncbi:MAG: AAA family ATPase [Desulfuromonas sp.]|nr:MAG: AAA family ATPase [Desulfuromonas sp.]